MQVSISLNETLVKKIDKLAKRKRRSRSKVIETLVESSLKAAGSHVSRFAPLVGAWKDDRSAKEIIREIYKGGRTLMRRVERPRLVDKSQA